MHKGVVFRLKPLFLLFGEKPGNDLRLNLWQSGYCCDRKSSDPLELTIMFHLPDSF